eukprot:CAMPEP_0178406512 /NCGR_PEP_ID=MMETSP0689_2-20121128/18949_1 /TAXON_ID=160604 /ORGANISM="Amphidinium massartii, Strain CS-259" /LENGTH=346 /DNA_ID=CAMNT_0020027553 /DNA_START=135 /DNA_END=1175 /DNA_ORIENTATION=+
MTSPTPEVQRSRWEAACWCAFYGAGVIGMLLIYGVLQERIMTVPYGGPRGPKFGDAVFLVFCNRLVAVAFACSMVVAKGESMVNAAPLWKYVAVSLSNVFASTCQYEALKYVSFPVQMLGKSFKMMPVMLWGMLVSGKRYSVNDWLIAAAVTGGVTEFLMTGPIQSTGSDGTSTKGLALLVVFLALDGFTSTFQEQLFHEYRTSKYNQMFYINSASCLVSSVTLVLSGGLSRSVAFIVEYPRLMGDATALSAAAVAGQWFIYSQVKEFGALVFAATMNVRQVVSILVSYATYGHSITSRQVLGLCLVFAALFYKSASGFLAPNDAKSGEQKPLLQASNAGPKKETA